MFLVRRAREVMESDMLVLDATTSLDSFLSRPDNAGRLRHVVVVQKDRISGVIRINTALRRGLESAQGDLTLGEVASRDFTIAREDDLTFDVINRMWRKNAGMAVVVKGRGVPHAVDVIGVISKEHVADSVAASIRIYPSETA
jgi:chloride channel protein, CIC family